MRASINTLFPADKFQPLPSGEFLRIENGTAICNTCNRPVDRPYRRYDNGRIVEGCVDECHGAHFSHSGQSSAWHFRCEAKSIRAASAKRRKGKPNATDPN